MAAETESLNILIKAKDMYSTELTRMVKKFKVAGIAMVGALAGVTVALVKMTNETAKAVEESARWAKITGVNIEELSKLEFITERLGGNVEHMRDVLKETSVKMKEASEGTGALFDNLKHLNISVVGVDGKLRDAGIVFNEIVDSLGKMENAALRTAIADEIWSDAGTELLPVLLANRKEVEALRKESDDFNHTITEDTAKAAIEYNKSIRAMNSNLQSLSRTIGKELIPLTARFTGNLDDTIKSIQEYFAEPTVEQLTKKIDDQLTAIEELKQKYAEETIFVRDSITFQLNKRKEIIDTLMEQRRVLIKNNEEEAKSAARGAGGLGPAIPTAEDFYINAAELRSLNAQFNFEMLELQQQSEQTAHEARQQAIDAEINQSMAAFEAEMAIEQQKNEALGILSMDRYALEQERREADLAAEIRNGQLRRQAARNTAQGIVSILEAFNTLSDNKNRSLFEALKLARASQAIVDTYTAANNALATVPYPYNFAAAFAVTAAGLANLAVISKTQFGSTAGAGGGGAAAPTAPPIRPITQAGVAERAAPAPAITFNISGTLGTEDWDQIAEEHIMPAINTALDRNSATLNVRTT